MCSWPCFWIRSGLLGVLVFSVKRLSAVAQACSLKPNWCALVGELECRLSFLEGKRKILCE